MAIRGFARPYVVLEAHRHADAFVQRQRARVVRGDRKLCLPQAGGGDLRERRLQQDAAETLALVGRVDGEQIDIAGTLGLPAAGEQESDDLAVALDDRTAREVQVV